jgi:hypothetical protein
MEGFIGVCVAATGVVEDGLLFRSADLILTGLVREGGFRESISTCKESRACRRDISLSFPSWSRTTTCSSPSDETDGRSVPGRNALLPRGIRTCCPVKDFFNESLTSRTCSKESFGDGEAAMLVVMVTATIEQK